MDKATAEMVATARRLANDPGTSRDVLRDLSLVLCDGIERLEELSNKAQAEIMAMFDKIGKTHQ